MDTSDDFPPSIALLKHFKLLTDSILNEMARTTDNLTVNQIQLIALLGEPMPMKAVSEALSMKPSNLTPLVQACVASGWLKREKLKTDQRVVSAVLTAEGHTLRRRLIDDLARIFRSLSGLTEEQAAEILTLATAPLSEATVSGTDVA